MTIAEQNELARLTEVFDRLEKEVMFADAHARAARQHCDILLTRIQRLEEQVNGLLPADPGTSEDREDIEVARQSVSYLRSITARLPGERQQRVAELVQRMLRSCDGF